MRALNNDLSPQYGSNFLAPREEPWIEVLGASCNSINLTKAFHSLNHRRHLISLAGTRVNFLVRCASVKALFYADNLGTIVPPTSGGLRQKKQKEQNKLAPLREIANYGPSISV